MGIIGKSHIALNDAEIRDGLILEKRRCLFKVNLKFLPSIFLVSPEFQDGDVTEYITAFGESRAKEAVRISFCNL